MTDPSLPRACPTAFQSGSARAGVAITKATRAVRFAIRICVLPVAPGGSCPGWPGDWNHASVSLARRGSLQHAIFRKPAFAPQLHALARDPDLIAAARLARVGHAELVLFDFPGAFSGGSHLKRGETSVPPEHHRPMHLVGEFLSGESGLDFRRLSAGESPRLLM